jgi:hypothetical protein
MSQNDLVISNQTFPATRADITSALQALGSTNSGPSAPSTTYANMMWYDTSANILKIRAEANDAWINIGYLDQSLDTFKILNDTIVATTGGATTGLIGDQSTATWQSGTGTTESLVSPAKVKAAIDSLVSVPDTLGVNQSYASTTLTTNTWYQNTTGRAIAIYYQLNVGGGDAFVSTTASGGVRVGGGDGDSGTWDNGYFIVPNTHYYRTTGSSNRAASRLS